MNSSEDKRIEETISDTFRPTDSALDKQGGWFRVQMKFRELMDRADRELDWPADIEIEVTIRECEGVSKEEV